MSEPATQFPYHQVDGIAENIDDVSKMAEGLTLIIHFFLGGKDAEDMRTRSAVFCYTVRPDLVGVETLEELAAYLGRDVTPAALNKLQTEFRRLTGFNSITNNNR